MPIRYALIMLAVVGAAVVVAQFMNHPEPIYAQVVFGENPDQRLGFIARGGDLYVDSDLSDGFQPVRHLGTKRSNLSDEIPASDGNAKYRNINVGLLLAPEAISEQRPQKLVVAVDVDAEEPLSLAGEVVMSREADQPGILSFERGFSIQPPQDSLPRRLTAGGQAEDIRVAVANRLPDGQATVIVNANQRQDGSRYAFRPGVGPAVEIEFASRVSDQPIVERFVLDAFC